jgi:hypothetical protein
MRGSGEASPVAYGDVARRRVGVGARSAGGREAEAMAWGVRPSPSRVLETASRLDRRGQDRPVPGRDERVICGEVRHVGGIMRLSKGALDRVPRARREVVDGRGRACDTRGRFVHRHR